MPAEIHRSPASSRSQALDGNLILTEQKFAIHVRKGAREVYIRNNSVLNLQLSSYYRAV